MYCFTSAFFGSVRMRTRSSRTARSARDHGDAADELGNHAELVQVLGKHLRQKLSLGVLLALGQLGREAQTALSDALADDVCQTDERTAQDEQDVRRVDVNEFLLGMLAPALRRHGRSVPSTIFKSACCTPSPDTSRVMERFSACGRSCRSRRCR